MFKCTTYYIYFCTYNDVRLWIIYSKNNVNNDPNKNDITLRDDNLNLFGGYHAILPLIEWGLPMDEVDSILK